MAFSVPETDPITRLENAIHGWVVTGSELTADHVIWGAEATGGGPVPSGTYIAMELIGVNRVSGDWLITRVEGGRIVHHVRGTRHPTLKLTCFSGARYGVQRASMILERVIAAIRLPSVGKLLAAADVGIGPRGQVRAASVPRSTMFDPRATVEIGLHIMLDVSEPGSSIERVNVEVEGRPAAWVPEPPP